MEIILGALFGVFVLAVLTGAFFMWVGAKIAGVEKATWGRSVLAAVGTAFVTAVTWLIFHTVPVAGSGLGFVIGLLLTLLVIKGAYRTGLARALLVWIFNVIAQIIAVVIGIFTFAGGLLILG